MVSLVVGRWMRVAGIEVLIILDYNTLPGEPGPSASLQQWSTYTAAFVQRSEVLFVKECFHSTTLIVSSQSFVRCVARPSIRCSVLCITPGLESCVL